jgi:hypothetical protein
VMPRWALNTLRLPRPGVDARHGRDARDRSFLVPLGLDQLNWMGT